MAFRLRSLGKSTEGIAEILVEMQWLDFRV